MRPRRFTALARRSQWLGIAPAVTVAAFCACHGLTVDDTPHEAETSADDASTAFDAGAFDAAPSKTDGALPVDGGATDANAEASSVSCNFGKPGVPAVGVAPVNVAGSRLHLRYLVLDDGSTKVLWDFFDPLLGSGCAPSDVSGCYPAQPRPGDPPYVAFTSVREPFIPGVDAVVRVGADGTRIWLGELYDAEHGVPATLLPRDTNTATVRDYDLLPTAFVSFTGGAIDAGECCSPALPGPCYGNCGEGCGYQVSCGSAAVMTKPIARRWTGYSTHVVAAGLPITTTYCIPTKPQDASTAAGHCPAPTQKPGTGWQVGPEVDPSCFFPVSSVALGSGQLQVRAGRAASVTFPVTFQSGSAFVQASPFDDAVSSSVNRFDAERGPLISRIDDTVAPASCAIIELEDGELHCVGGVVGLLYFSDAACTAPAAVANADPNPHVISGPFPDIPDRGLLTTQHRAYGLGAPIAGTPPFGDSATWALQADGTCKATGFAGKLVEATPLATSTFPIVHLVMD